MLTFVYKDDKSNKVWNIELNGSSFTVTFGKVGAKGQSQTKVFPDEPAAIRAHDRRVAEKLAKGYVEVTTDTPGPVPAPPAPALPRAKKAAREATPLPPRVGPVEPFFQQVPKFIRQQSNPGKYGFKTLHRCPSVLTCCSRCGASASWLCRW